MKQHVNRKLAKAAHFDVDIRHGLTDSQVEARLNEGLVNKTKKKVTKSYGRIIFDNLFNFLNIILFCAAKVNGNDIRPVTPITMTQ